MDRIMVASELVRIARGLLAIEFPTQEAMDKYLKEHPDADRSNHRVVKTKGQGGKGPARKKSKPAMPPDRVKRLKKLGNSIDAASMVGTDALGGHSVGTTIDDLKGLGPKCDQLSSLLEKHRNGLRSHDKDARSMAEDEIGSFLHNHSDVLLQEIADSTGELLDYPGVDEGHPGTEVVPKGWDKKKDEEIDEKAKRWNERKNGHKRALGMADKNARSFLPDLRTKMKELDKRAQAVGPNRWNEYWSYKTTANRIKSFLNNADKQTGEDGAAVLHAARNAHPEVLKMLPGDFLKTVKDIALMSNRRSYDRYLDGRGGPVEPAVERWGK